MQISIRYVCYAILMQKMKNKPEQISYFSNCTTIYDRNRK